MLDFENHDKDASMLAELEIEEKFDRWVYERMAEIIAD